MAMTDLAGRQTCLTAQGALVFALAREESVLTERAFVDHYEVLQLNPTADTETIERVYRLLAKRYHPDNLGSGDTDRFAEVQRAFDALSNPERRAVYDVKYTEEKSVQWQIFEQGTAADDRDQDQRIFHGILSLLYVARRRDPEGGGLGPVHLERTLGTPREHLGFPVWYLKRRGFIETNPNGLLAITVAGVDELGSRELSLPDDRLLAASSIGEKQRDAEAPDRQRTISGGNGHALTEATDADQTGDDRLGPEWGVLH